MNVARLTRPLVLLGALTVLAGCDQTGDPSTAVPSGSVTLASGDAAIHGTYDVGGHELFLDCSGTGTTSVVMFHGIIWEAGYGGDSSAWTATRAALANTRTCAYDRRNVGLSGQVPGMSTAADAVKDLHELLRTAGVEPPYVLAGHSFGGLLSLLYAGTYPDEVAGIVLVDATLPLEWDLDPVETRKSVEAELNANGERIDFYGAGALAASALDRLPDVPITYLRALRQQDPPDWEEGAYEAALRKFMRDLPNGKLVEFDTDHDMLIDIPADVAEQIRRVLAQSSV